MRNRRKTVLRVLLAFTISGASAPFLFAQAQTGEWTMGHTSAPGKVHFTLQSSRDDDHSFSTSSDWNVSDFQELDWSSPGKHDVRFTIPRDAGTFQGEGFLKDGEGAGLFTFKPNAQYSHEMETLGFAGVTDEKQMSFAIHDVSVAFAREMKAENIDGLDTNKLIAFRIFRVDSEFVKAIRAAGINDISAEKLVAFRIHGVTPEFIKSIRDAGLNVSDPQKLIAFRIHGVTPDYVKDLAKLGYPNPGADQLIALRIHRVTPEYIEKMREHGMQNLTLDQLVRLRIHNIE